jgi:hypothetical protein
MNALPRPLLVSLALGTLPIAARAQTVRSDSARLVVTQAGRPIGTEDFALRIGTGSAGSPEASFVATTNGDSESLRVVVAVGARRITIRVASAAGEAAREYPGGSRSLVVDERVLSLFTLVARVDPGTVTVFGPPPGGRRSASLSEVGQDRFPGAPQPLRHLVLRSGEDVVDIWLDPQGRLIRVAIPSRELVAERVTQP